MIRVRRIYDPPVPEGGRRFLVDRLWPRGVSRSAAALDGWVKHAAPSDALRSWFAHDPARWQDFLKRYHEELDEAPGACETLLQATREGDVTLLYAARDTEHNNAVALRIYLERRAAELP